LGKLNDSFAIIQHYIVELTRGTLTDLEGETIKCHTKSISAISWISAV